MNLPIFFSLPSIFSLFPPSVVYFLDSKSIADLWRHNYLCPRPFFFFFFFSYTLEMAFIFYNIFLHLVLIYCILRAMDQGFFPGVLRLEYVDTDLKNTGSFTYNKHQNCNIDFLIYFNKLHTLSNACGAVWLQTLPFFFLFVFFKIFFSTCFINVYVKVITNGDARKFLFCFL